MPTCSNPPSGIMYLLSMKFDTSVFSVFLFKKANPIAAFSPEMSYFAASIQWKMPENIIKIERQTLVIFKDIIEQYFCSGCWLIAKI